MQSFSIIKYVRVAAVACVFLISAGAVAQKHVRANEQGLKYMAQGKYEDAISSFSKAIEEYDFYAEAFYNRAYAKEKAGKNKSEYTGDYLRASNLYKPVTVADFKNVARAAEMSMDDGQPLYNRKLEYYTEGLKISPNDQELLLARSATYRRMFKYKEAGEDYYAVMKLNPENKTLISNGLSTLMGAGLYDKVIEQSDLYLRTDPDNLRVRRFKADARFLNKDSVGAINELSEIIKQYPTYDTAYFSRAYYRNRMKQHEGALADYAEVLRLSPGYLAAYLARGVILRDMKRYPEANAEFENYIRLKPNGIGYAFRGTVKDLTGKREDALKDFTKGLEVDARSSGIFYRRWARLYFDSARYDRAIEHYSNYVKTIKECDDCYEQLGKAKEKLGRFDAARNDFISSASLDKTHIHGFYVRAIEKLADRNYAQAIKDYSQYLEMEKPGALTRLVYQNRGLSKYMIGDYSGAIDDLTKSIAEANYMGEPYLYRAQTWAAIGNQAASDADFKKALEISNNLVTADSRNAGYYFLRAQVHHGRGEVQEAENDLRTARGLDSGSKIFRDFSFEQVKHPETTNTVSSAQVNADPLSAPGVSKKVALVIGIKSYEKVQPLVNTLNDAKDIAILLRAKGFQVIELLDPRMKSDVRNAVIRFSNALEGQVNSVGMVYYSGHGMQVDGSNYIIPAAADLQVKADVEDQCVNMDYILRTMETNGNQLNILVLDACRNNPFRSFSRATERGLNMVNAPKGSYIVYSTKPGSVASDGNGRNGLFTSKLIKYISEPNLSIEQVFKKVAADVSKDSGDQQRPWISSDFTGDFYFTLK